jgi:uncharacterized protein HemY
MWWKENTHLADYVMKPLRNILEDQLLRGSDAKDVIQLYELLTPEDAQRRVARLEETYKTYDDRLEAFSWAKDPARTLGALYRRAGKDPRSR